MFWNLINSNHTNVSCDWSADGYMLPTEMQREFAARGGVPAQNADTFNDTWAGTDEESDLGDYAWYNDNSGSTTHPVGTKLPNELVLYDMSGNVFNWVWDIWGSYPAGSYADPKGPNSGFYRMSCGGSWNIFANGCAVSYRVDSHVTYNYNFIGFRLARFVE